MLEVIETIYKGRQYKTLNSAIDASMLEIATRLDKLPIEFKKELFEFLQRVAGNTVKQFIPFSKRNRGQQKDLQIRSGKTKAAILRSPEVKDAGGGELRGFIGGPKHLAINEFGGVEGPKFGDKYVYIPLDAALTNKGLPIAASPKNWKNTFIRKTKKGNLVMFQRRAGMRPVPLYLLKRTVKIPARLRMARAIEAASPYFEKKLMAAVDRGLA